MSMMRLMKWPYPRRQVAVAITAIALVLLAAFFFFRASGAKSGPGEQPTYEVQHGPLTISILQSGTIQAKEQEIIASEVEGQTTIIYLIEEGMRVKKGDLLVELDASALQDGLVEQQIRVQNAEAAFIRARENLGVVKNQAESDVSLAELNFRFAKEDLTQYTEGQYKQQLMAADSKITLAEEELQLAVRKLEWSEKLFAENYISQSERDSDRLSHKRAKLDLDLSQADKKLLENFTYTRQVAQLKSNVDQTGRALERAKLKAAADIVQADADLKAKEAEWHQQQGKEKKIVEQIQKTKILAPREGLVVYATSAKSNMRGGNQTPLEAGQVVRERQELIYLPTADQMIAVVQVHESRVDDLRLGLPVVVTVDALQGRSFVGRVTRIAPLPDATSVWLNPDLKVYRTEITIDERQPDLRTGMSCMTEIIVAQYEDAVYVPVQAVLRVTGKPTVYVRQGNDFVPVPVEVGLNNNRMIRILSGLQPGQTVLLTPPLQEAATAAGGQPGNGNVDAKKLQTLIDEANATQPAATNAVSAAGAPAPGARRELTPEQRAERQRRMEAMTPEQRQEMQKRFGGGQHGGRTRDRQDGQAGEAP